MSGANLPPVTPTETPYTPEPSEPQKPDLMGYESVDALVAAKRSSDQHAKQMAQRLQELEAQQYRGPANPTPYDGLEAVGVPTDLLRQAITTEARNLLREELAPLAAMGTAREKMLASHPDFQKFEPELNRFLQANPEVNEQYQWAIQNARQNPKQAEMAMEWSYLKFGEEQRRKHRAAPGQTQDPGPAAIPSSSAQERGNASAGPDADKVQKAFEYGKKFGDWRAFAHERLKGIIPDSHFQ